ncbi:hypothetical protein DFQ27_001335 [Actinomortierella ambigua]|uniref:Mtf2-like C-terminal domain-containing protein n=1 Tax=Actinomortierella ambigua TaxID=1343610 RepID=A0A9P6QE49_9FUNG|nr:hypothetical protein DFQ27_001335 [Actinomortierella ambigua]
MLFASASDNKDDERSTIKGEESTSGAGAGVGAEAGSEVSSKDAQPLSAEELIKQYQSKPSAEVGIRAKQRVAAAAAAAEADKEASSATGAVSSSRSLFQKLRDPQEEAAHDNTGHGEGGKSESVSDQWKFLFDETEFEGRGEGDKAVADKGLSSQDLLDQIPGSSVMFPSLTEYADSPRVTKSRIATSPQAASASTLRQQQQSGEQWRDPKMNNAEKDAFKALFVSLFETKPKEDTSSAQKEPLSIFSTFKRPSSAEEKREEGSTDSSALSTSSSSTTPAKKEDPMDLLDRHLKTLSTRTGFIYVRGPEKPKPYVAETLEKSLVGDEVWAEQSAEARDDSIFLQIREENMAAIRVRNELNGFEHDVAGLGVFVSDLLHSFSAATPPAAPLPLSSATTTTSSTTKDPDNPQEEEHDQPQLQSPSTTPAKPKVSGLVMDELLARAITIASSSDVQAKTTPTLILTGLASSSSPSSSASSSSASFLDHQYPQRTKSLQPLMGGAFVEHARRQGLSTFIQTVRSESYKALIRTRWENFRDTAGCLAILREMQQNGALIDPELQSMIKRMGQEVFTHGQNYPGMGWDAVDQQTEVREMMKIVRQGREQDDWNGDRTTTTMTMAAMTESAGRSDEWQRSDNWKRPGNFGDRRPPRSKGGQPPRLYRNGARGGDNQNRPGYGDSSPFPEFIHTTRY